MHPSEMMISSKQKIVPHPLAFLWPININKELEDSREWEEELQAIRSAGPQDIVHMFYSSPGGNLTVMKEFATAMDQCPAHIICEATGDLASAVTMLFLKGDEFIVGDDASFMIHNSRVGYGEKTNNFLEFARFYEKSNANLVKKYYKDFLTEEEINIVLQGGDHWFDAEELRNRLRQFVDKREAAAEEAMSEMQSNEEEQQSICPKSQYADDCNLDIYLELSPDKDVLQVVDRTTGNEYTLRKGKDGWALMFYTIDDSLRSCLLTIIRECFEEETPTKESTERVRDRFAKHIISLAKAHELDV